MNRFLAVPALLASRHRLPPLWRRPTPVIKPMQNKL